MSDNKPSDTAATLVSKMVRTALADLPEADAGASSIQVDGRNVHRSLSVLACLIEGDYRLGFHSSEAERRYGRAARATIRAKAGVSDALRNNLCPAASVALLLRMAGHLARAHGIDRRLCARLSEHYLDPTGMTQLSIPMLTSLGEALARSERSDSDD